MKFFITLLILFSFNCNASELAKCQLYLLTDIVKMYPVQIELPGFGENQKRRPKYYRKKTEYFTLTKSVTSDAVDAVTGASVPGRAKAGAKLAFSPIIVPLTVAIDTLFVTPFKLIQDLHRAKKTKQYERALKQYGQKYEQEYNKALAKIEKAYAKIKGSKWKLALLKKRMEVLQLFTTVRRMLEEGDNYYNDRWQDDYYLHWLLEKMKKNNLISSNLRKSKNTLNAILQDLDKTIQGKCSAFPTIEKYFAAYRAI